MVKGVDRRPDLGYQAAVNVATAVRIVQEDRKRSQKDNSEDNNGH